MKRTLALLLTLAMLVSALPPSAVAAADRSGGPIKILTIGSDLAADAADDLYRIADAEGTDVVLGVACYNGATLQQHVSFAQNNSAVYRFRKNSDGAWTTAQGATLLSCIQDEAWDVICFEQGAAAAAQVNAYGDLGALLTYVDANKTNANAQYAWHMVWAYQAGYPDASFTAASQTAMYSSIAGAVGQVISPDTAFDYLIPSGTAIQNARSSLFGDTLTRDGQHLNATGKLIAGYTWYRTLTGTALTGLNYTSVDGETLSETEQTVVMEAVNNAASYPCTFTASQYPAGRTTHYSWVVKNGNSGAEAATATIPTIETNLLWPAGVSRSTLYNVKYSYYYGANGRTSLRTFQIHDASGYTTDAETGNRLYYGLPSRELERTTTIVDEESEDDITTLSTYETANTENLRLDLIQMPQLNTAGLGAVNLSMTYAFAHLTSSRDVSFLRALRVYVSLDGTNFLSGWAGVRSVKLLGGGMNESGGSPSLFYSIETEDLLDIPGVAGNTIKLIRIMPDGVNTRTFSKFYVHGINVYTYATQQAFDLNCPCTLPELVNVGETTMRNIVVAEAVRTATTPWQTSQSFYTQFGAQNKKPRYLPGYQIVGPVYERDIDSTRELFASGIDQNGYWGANGTGFSPVNGKNKAYGMDCQAFVWNAIGRVGRSYGWGTPYLLSDPHASLLGGLDGPDIPYYTDVDIIDNNTDQEMYEAYALVQPGDVIEYYAFEGSGGHTRVVKSVNVVRNLDGTIDPTASTITYAHQGSMTSWLDSNYHSLGYLHDTPGAYINMTPPTGTAYIASSRADDTSSFNALRNSKYVPITLTDYAAGKIEREDVQVVAGSRVAGGSFTDGVHIAISSNYFIPKFTVSLRDTATNTELFTDTMYSMQSRLHSFNYGDENYSAMGSPVTTASHSDDLDDLLASLPDGRYRLSVAVDSGPLLSTTQSQVPTTVKNFDFTVGTPGSCSGNHTGKTALTQDYIDALPLHNTSTNHPFCRLPAGSYYLTEDIDYPGSIMISAGAEVTICLNGYNLRGTLAASNAKTYHNNAFLCVNGTLNLCDHTGNGILQANANGEVTSGTYAPYVMYISGVFNFHSGNISNSRGRYGVILITKLNNSNDPMTMNMYGGTISGNYNASASNSAAAAIEMQSKSVFNMYGGTISGNGTASTGGSAVDLNSNSSGTPSFNLFGGTISGNHSLKGAVRVMGGTTFHMYGGTISGNDASTYGGGVCVYGTEGRPATFEMAGGTISGNSASTQGGGVSVGAYGVFDFSGGTISGNTAQSGGGVCLISASATLNMSADAAVTTNAATSDGTDGGIGGGGIGVVDGSANLAGGAISGNTSANNGGGVSVYEGAVSTANVTVSGNSAVSGGGGIFLGSTEENTTVAPTLLMTGGTAVSGNTAAYGAGIRAAGASAAMTVTGGTVSGNNGAGGAGTGYGAIYLTDGTTAYLTGGTITGNHTASAAVYVKNSTVNMSGGNITGNTSASHGGGIVMQASGTLNISGGNISGNSGGTGRDVYIAGNNAAINMTGGTLGTNGTSSVWFYNNTAANTLYGNFYGGTVYSYIGTSGSAAKDVKLWSGNFWGLTSDASQHAGIQIYGGQYKSIYYLTDPTVCMLPNPQLVTTSDPVFSHQPVAGTAP